MPVYREPGCTIAFPILLREIDMPEADVVGGRLRDVTSVYGMPGPISSTSEISDDILIRFADFLQDFLQSQRVVAAFSRLNPILQRQFILKYCGDLVEMGPTVFIDLTKPPDVQWADYRRTHRVGVQRLREVGFVCKHVGEECLDDFMRVYRETMDRVSADPYYYFDRSYYEYLLTEMSDTAHLFVCLDRNIVVCSTFVMVCNGVIQGHLGGTANSYLAVAPMKLMIDGLRLWGNSIGAHTLNVGGGVGGKSDSLLFFKRGFSKEQRTYYTWRHIVDRSAYDRLCQAAIDRSGFTPEESYFPLYRHPGFAQQRPQASREEIPRPAEPAVSAEEVAL